MTVLLILQLCLNDVCIEKTPFDRVGFMECAVKGQLMAADWLNENMHGWRLAGYRCVAGPRRVGV